MSAGDEAGQAVAVLVPPLLDALEALGSVARHIAPAGIAALLSATAPMHASLCAALDRCRAGPPPPGPPDALRAHLLAAADAALLAFDELRAAAASATAARQAFRALRNLPRAEAALYPAASVLPAVSRFFLEPDARDGARAEALARADPTRAEVGVMHTGEAPGERGGFSAYVPEDYDPARAYPLVIALHGGSGNGGAFLWSWLRAARTHGAILVAPTATGPTWALRDPEHDTALLDRILLVARERWRVDPSRLLLTGMSDGGTFALLSGLGERSPFTHLAPAATGFHPALLEFVEPARLAGLPIYLIHGALDWMFDVGRARGVARALAASGARLTYREIADLTHAYPRDENGRVLDWLQRD